LANQTSFATAGYTVGFVDAFLNGVRLNTADITASNGSDIVLASGAAVNDILDVISYATFEINAQTFTGTTTLTDVVATSLDISGNIDIDGITNLDVVNIAGAVSVGVDDTGYDVKFFGDTASAYMLWDASADDLILGGAAGLSVNSTALVTGVLTTTASTVFNGGFASNGDSLMGTNKKLLFRDSAIHISSTSDGLLNIDADTEVDITSTLIDINGAVEISGTTNSIGNMTVGDVSNDATLHVLGATFVGNASGNATIDNNLTGTGLDVAVGSGTKLVQFWDDNDTSVPRVSVLRNGQATFSQTRTETNTEADIGAYVNLRNLSAAINTGIGLTLGSNNNGGAVIVAQRVGANNEHVMKFQTRNSSGANLTRMQISGGGIVTAPFQPAFIATNGPTNIAQNTIIVFSAVEHNVGGCYNVSNGRFTAPVAGLYSFSISGLYTSGASGHVATFKGSFQNNNVSKGVAYEYQTTAMNSGYNTIGSASVLIYMNANQFVHLKNEGAANAHMHISGTQTKFCGHLVG